MGVLCLYCLGKALVDTVEVSQTLLGKIECTEKECQYLINIYNIKFERQITPSNVSSGLSGLQPIVASHLISKESFFSVASSEEKIEAVGKVITVYGGKWTSASSLAGKVVKEIKRLESKEVL